ncbi:MAG: hypothetical protein HQK97_05675 [Nitrospirae bacterium]|nr:hypothetical protein [Nitrospirota bacterium]
MALVYDLERDMRFRQGRERAMIEGILEGKGEGLLEAIELRIMLVFVGRKLP